MTTEYVYVYATVALAQRFENAAAHEGYDVNRVGNACIAEAGAMKAVTDAFTVYEDQAPVWTSDPELRLPVNSAVSCRG